MKTIQIISALLAVSASLSMAGVIDIYTSGKKQPSTSLNLTTIDSLTFSGKGEKKVIDFSGKAKQKAIKLSKIDQVKFSLKDKSKETMTVTVGEGIMAGEYKFKLSEIKKIEIVEMDAKEDADGDGLTDLDEIYKYDTNPNSADTDGDGWSDGEELADGMYSPKNPTKFNPRIADVPGLRVTLKKSPSITLNITTSEGGTLSETVTEGKEVSKTNSTSYEESRSTDIMHAWEFSTTHGWAVGKESGYNGNVSVGYNGSYTSSNGMTWNSSEEKSVAESYEKAIANEKSENREVSGATLCMQVELKNTSDIAFTIEALKLSASMYDIKDTATLKILAELNREDDWSDITLKPAESIQAYFCNNDVKIELIEDLIYNTSSIVLGTTSQKITIDGGNSDFTKVYTKVAAKTADITIDYGPGATGNRSVRYQVATNYRYNIDHKGSDDMYAETSVADLLRNAHVDFEQDSVKGPSKKKLYGLASIDEYKYNLKDSAMWYVTIQRAADFKKGLNTMELYTFAHASYDLEKIFVGAGDAVHIFYSKDQDHDGVSLPTEHLFGTDDKKVDSDGDGLSDYDEITGWTKGKSKVKIYTDPTNDDTDDDGLNDKEDPEPTKRAMFKDASLFKLQVFSDSSMAKSSRLLNKDSSALAGKSSFDVTVPAPSAFINVVPNAGKVAWVKFTTGETIQYVEPTVENGKNVYTFRTPGKLKILQNTDVSIEVKSEDETTVKKYTLSISSKIAPPTNLKLGKNIGRSHIVVNFDRSKDNRVKGYVILRGIWNNNLPDTIENGARIDGNSTYKGFVPIVIDSAKNSYSDHVWGGSSYHAYRVYAYGMEGDDMVFSEGTEQHYRSVGRIKVRYNMFDFGAEYYYFAGCVGRADITANITLHAGSTPKADTLYSWYGFDYEAGFVGAGETVKFLIEDGKGSGDVTPNFDVHVANVGAEGLYMNFDVVGRHNSCHIEGQQGIYWPYENMANVLNGDANLANGRSGAAPKQGENRILVGAGGIKYDDASAVCTDACGAEPHTGYKIWIEYEWMDDEEYY